MKPIRMLSAIAAVATLTACALEPPYERPDAPVVAAFPQPSPAPVDPQTAAATATATATADIGWRDFFSDVRLQRLIEIALDNNRDLRVAVLNIEAARARYRIQRSELLPGVDASASETAQGLPDALTVPGQPSTTHTYSANLGITAYELDLFGRVRSLSHAALQQYLSVEETRRSVQIALVAEVASAYLSERTDQALLEMTADTLTSQQASYELTQRSFEAETASAVDLRQAQTTRFRRLVQQDRNALLLLLGVPALPADLPAPKSLDEQQLLTELPAGVPSEVLTQRPDVSAAEHRLIAANANIGAARAAFFPRITLTGSYGTMSTELDGLFDSGSSAWSFVPSITVPIFTGGANRANLELAEVLRNIDIARYEQAIQSAFREVADALVARGTLDEQLAAQQALVEATQDSHRLAEMRFSAGVDSYFAVLDAQRSLYSAQQAYLSTRLARLQNLVTLYKALGGGWNEQTLVRATAGR